MPYVVVSSLSHVWLLQPHGLGPTWLLYSWDIPGKNTGVGCHFLLKGIFLTQGSNLGLLHWLLLSWFSQVRLHRCVRPHRRQPTRLPRPWDSPGKNTGVGCHFLLQRIKVKSESEVAQSCRTPSDPINCSLPGFSVHGIFQTRADSLPLSHLGSPNVLWCSKKSNSHIQSLCSYLFSTLYSNPVSMTPIWIGVYVLVMFQFLF